jgi:hypothetical protein
MERSYLVESIKKLGFSISDVCEELSDIRDYLETYDDDEIADDDGVPGTDVRINSTGEGFKILYGDSSYDDDHRGFWGSSYVRKGSNDYDLIEIAYDLIEQLLEDMESMSD